MKGLVTIFLTIMTFTLSGCTGCNPPWPWPSPSPTPVPDFGTIIKTLPASHNGIGSIDLVDGSIWEYCQGHAELRKRDMDGDLQEIVELDGRLTGLWAVCWDPQRSAFWCTNPDIKNFESENGNLIKVNRQGGVIQVIRVSDNWGKPYLTIRDIDYNDNYEYEDADGNKITKGLLRTADWHYSLRKCDYIDPDNGFWETFWWRLSDIQHAAVTEAGGKYYASTDGDNPINGEYPILESDQVGRKQWAPNTGRQIVVPGVWFSSLKTEGRSLWGKGIRKSDKQTLIYQISLGES